VKGSKDRSSKHIDKYSLHKQTHRTEEDSHETQGTTKMPDLSSQMHEYIEKITKNMVTKIYNEIAQDIQ